MRFQATGRVVLPGDKLCVVEEFIPDSGAKALRDGSVVATVSGIAEYDIKNHTVKVKPAKPSVKIKQGDLVLCQVKDVQDKLIICDILAAAGHTVKTHWTAAALSGRRAPAFTVGDILVARVRDEYYGIYTLTVKGRGLGVFQAFCDTCGGPLTLSGRGLFCNRCKRKYPHRPLVPYYGKVNTLLKTFGGLLSPEGGGLLWKSR
ncbi:MAG: exosome complex RNA-binding protein Csl4 [Nitrososphaerota archaeon]|nr:exosome complex RNA-binding protein Csl4 [Candidatus Calditenuaceae archaeon]MDW8073604.1 exosome complex RNA-binding protein Csl4 [Nitrososphaerota archaeon]